MRTSLLLLAAFAASALAAPAQTVAGRSLYDWSPALANFYAAVDRHIQIERGSPNYPNPPSCAVTAAQQPVAPTPLPAPDPSWQLQLVAIGRGVQNYTCANSSATPASIGAVANLYNASCVAANYPDLLAQLPNLALQYPLPSEESSSLQPPNIDLAGHHYFITPTSPIFNMDADAVDQLGIAAGHKVANSTAPSTAPKGQDGSGYGAVPWLYLSTTNATIGNLKAVYRLNTAGGSPPPNCLNSPASFSVQYAAEYWFYA